MHPGATNLYDSIELWARACAMLPLSQCQDNATAVLEVMRNVSFRGKSAFVKLDRNGDVLPDSLAIYNYLFKVDGMMNAVLVALFSTGEQQFEPINTIIWPGNSTEIPADRSSGTLCIHCT